MEMHIGRPLKKKTKNRKGGRKNRTKHVSMTEEKAKLWRDSKENNRINLEPEERKKIANKKNKKGR